MIDIFLCDKREENERERERVRARLTYVVSARPRTGDVRNDLSGDEILEFFLREHCSWRR